MYASPLIHLRNADLHASLRLRGAALVGLRFAPDDLNLVLGFADPEAHDHVPIYAGALVGPIANRLQGGRLQIDGQTYQMDLNEGGITTLHSGPDGLHARNWDVLQQSKAAVTLGCTLPDGACGLPGTREITARYSLDGSTLILKITATTDAATPINIAAHPYWNLDGQGDLRSHRLHLNTNQYLPTDADNLPLNAPEDTTGSLFDFSTPRAIPRGPA